MSALHSFSLAARLTRGSATRRRGDRLTKSRWRTVRHVARCSPAPEAAACRTADAQVLPRDPAAESVLLHLARDLAPHLVVALAGDHVLAAATVHPRKLTAVLLSLLRPGTRHRLWRSRALFTPASAAFKRRGRKTFARSGRRGCYARTSSSAGSTAFKRRRRHASCAFLGHLPLLRVVAARRACLFHAQPVTANRLTRAPALHPGPRDRLCRAVQA